MFCEASPYLELLHAYEDEIVNELFFLAYFHESFKDFCNITNIV